MVITDMKDYRNDNYWAYRYWVRPRGWDKDTIISALLTLGAFATFALLTIFM